MLGKRLADLFRFPRRKRTMGKKRRPKAGIARATDTPQRGLEYVPGGGFAGPVAEGMRRGKAAAMEESMNLEEARKKFKKFMERRKAERLRRKNRKLPYDPRHGSGLNPYPSPLFEA